MALERHPVSFSIHAETIIPDFSKMRRIMARVDA